MSEPMMRLGSFTFSLETAAYQEFQRTSEYIWAAQGRTGQDDALQSTGKGPDIITLPGVIIPEFRGGTGQLDALRALAGQQKPQTLIDGRGRVLGDWVVTSVEERGDVFSFQGVARRQQFTVKLRRCPPADVGGLASVVAPIVAGVLPVSKLLSGAQAVAATAAKGPAGVLASLTGSLSTLTGMASSLGSQANTVLGAVRGGINAAKTLQNAGKDAGKLLASAKNLANLPSAMNGLVNIGGNVSRAAGVASSTLSDAASKLTDVSAFKAVQDAMISVNKLNISAVKVRTQAEQLKYMQENTTIK